MGRVHGRRARGAPSNPGCALHGLRRSVLPVGDRLPDRQSDPRVERPRLPRPLAGGAGPPAQDEQLSRIHRPSLPGPV